jgi:UPF0755 protein
MAWNNGYAPKPRRSKLPRRILGLIIVLVVLAIAAIFAVRHLYYQGLGPVSEDQTTQIVTIESGSSSKEIAELLEQKHLIRSAWAFELYVHSKQVGDKLKAGTYALSPNLGTPSIISTISKGAVTTNLVTILPGRRLDQVRADLINDGFKPEAVDAALDPAQYADEPVMAYKPAGASLEGLLYPDSFQRTADTDPSVIIRESLQEMATHLTADIQAQFAQQGMSTYQAISLASIIEKEVSRPVDRAQVAQVFLKRMRQGMALESDATTSYGAILAGKQPSTNFDSAYNTYKHQGLPPTPISSVTKSSLQAIANPAATDWLFFVSGDDGVTHFATNLSDQEANISKYCHKLCSQ